MSSGFWKVFSNDTTLHGLKELSTPTKLPIRLAWFTIVLTCVVLAIYQIIRAAIEYDTYPKSTSMTVLHRNNIPIIVVCPKKWIDTQKLNAYNVSYSALKFATTMLPAPLLHLKIEADDDEDSLSMPSIDDQYEFENSLGNMTRDGDDLFEFFDQISLDADAFLNCSCCDSMSKHIGLSGMCYELILQPCTDQNVGPMEIRINQPPFSQKIGHSFDFPYVDETAKIYVGPASISLGDFYAHTSASQQVINVEDHTFVNLYIKTTAYKRLNHKDSPCLPARDDSFHPERACRAECMMQHIDVLGNCRILLTASHGVAGLSATGYNGTCSALMVSADSLSDYMDAISEPCGHKRCPTSCEELLYETYQSAQTLLPNQAFHAVIHVKTPDRYTLISEQYVYSWDTLISNIGGLLGLWMGASLMSLFQFFYLMWLSYDQQRAERALRQSQKTVQSRLEADQLAKRVEIELNIANNENNNKIRA